MTTSICPACQVELQDASRKEHVRSEWHIYNLKRAVAGLPPLPEAEFSKKQAFFASTSGASGIQEASKKRYCQYCKKSFNSIKSYDNHLASRQHKFNVDSFKGKTAFGEQLKAIRLSNQPNEEVEENNDEDEENEENRLPQPLPVGACLFCDRTFHQESDSVDRVLRHMSDAHAFDLPYADKVADPQGLLVDLGRLVGVEGGCLGCGRQFIGGGRKETLAAVRAHMRDTNHNFLYTGVVDPVCVALAVAQNEIDNGEEEQEGAIRSRSLPPIARVGGELYSQFYVPERADNTLVLPDDANGEAYEVHLPSGGVLGHRKHYQSVYRQNLAFSLALEEARRRRLALQTSAALTGPSGSGGRQLPLAIAARHGGVLTVSSTTAATGGERLSRVDAHRQTTQRSTIDKYNLDLGMRGNYVLRGHLRRQY